MPVPSDLRVHEVCFRHGRQTRPLGELVFVIAKEIAQHYVRLLGAATFNSRHRSNL
jgi:hypothetical protein